MLALLLACCTLLPQDVTLKARFVDEAGQPIEGVTLRFLGSSRGAVSDADGLASLRVKGQRPILELRAEGFAPRRWTPTYPYDVQSFDLGEQTLHPGATVTGRIVDAEGEAVRGVWTVTAQTTEFDSISVEALLDERSGEYRLVDAPLGRLALRAQGPHGQWTRHANVVTEAGLETYAQLQFEGVAPGRWIQVNLSMPPGNLQAFPIELTLTDADGGVSLQVVEARYRSLEATFKNPGRAPYRLRLDDARFELFERRNLQPGTKIDERLVGAARLALEVLDAEGRPVPAFHVTCRGQVLPITDGVISGLLTGVQDLSLVLPGQPTLRLETDHLWADETIAMRVVLPPPGGQVRMNFAADGFPLPGVPVRIAGRSLGRDLGLPGIRAQSGADGKLEHVTPLTGGLDLEIEWAPYLVEERYLALSPDATSFELKRPPSGSLRLELLAPVNAPADVRLRVKLIPVDGALSFPGTDRPLQPGGRPWIERLPAGEVEVRLMFFLALGSARTRVSTETRRFQIEDGAETLARLDYTHSWPAAIEVRVRVDGAPARWPILKVIGAPSTSQLIAQQGTTTLIPPGPRRVRCTARNGTWVREFELDAAPGASLLRSLTIQRVRRQALFVSPRGEPLAGRVDFTWTGAGISTSGRFTLDEEGGASIAFEPGQVELRLAGRAPLVIDWNAELAEALTLTVVAKEDRRP